MPPRRFLVAFVASLLFVPSGCGPAAEERPPLQPASGTLTINGEPAEGAMLVLHPENGEPFDSRGTRPRATVAADGRFELTTYQSGDGAPVGNYRVAILWLVNPDSSNSWDKLGGRFSNPKQTDVRITVRPDETQLGPIELEGVRVQSRPPARGARDLDQVD